jgi:tetratricopeptide (TPR) repeat protein
MIPPKNIEFEKILNLYRNKNFLEAKSKCEKMIAKNRNNILANQLLAKIEIATGNIAKAISILNFSIKKNPKNISLLIDLGNTHKELNNFQESFECYHNVIKLDPFNLIAYHNSGNLLFKMGNYKQAIDLYSKAYHLDNNHVNSVIGVAKSYELLEDYSLAISVYEGLLDKFIDNEAALLGLGNLYRKINRHDKALEMAEEAVAKYPNNANCYSLRGVVKKELGLLPEALVDFKKMKDISPNSDLANNNIAMTLLMMGDYLNGWNLFEARWNLEEGQKKKYNSSKPLWNGEQACALLVWAEQGIGDQVMYSSILSEVAASVDQLFVLVDKRLKEIFSRSFDSKIQFITSREEAEKTGYDFHLPMGSMAKFFRNSEEDFNQERNSYLSADPIKASQLRLRLAKREDEKLIGVSWKSINPNNGLKRGVALIDFLEKINEPGYQFVNLQYGDIAQDLKELNENSEIKLISLEEIDNFQNIDGLAALIMACDEVISIDNSTVHLSGALGKNTKVLLQSSADWRWQQFRTDTPWYPSMQLIRDAIY